MTKKKTIYVMLIILKEQQGPVLAFKSYTTKAKAERAKKSVIKDVGKSIINCFIQKSELM